MRLKPSYLNLVKVQGKARAANQSSLNVCRAGLGEGNKTLVSGGLSLRGKSQGGRREESCWQTQKAGSEQKPRGGRCHASRNGRKPVYREPKVWC